ncbi:MAG: diaminopimelate epimerase [Opitutae bacterium]|jgi:diaminopimelate epimerase|nr:diaminopimelate epimerase [Opitutae bacterium]MBT5689638.1 diaminopimelate epimerase [Opitutae bacterium]MBT7851696.1 diaminopimelate epimerase [Opitutae bacterium]
MKFEKYHALGNDYLVLPSEELKGDLTEEAIRLICHRNFGLGSDGILLGPLPSDKAQFGLRIFNPDGSEAEKSGNGLRIFSLYLWDTGQVKDEPFTIDTMGGVVKSQILDGPDKISVEMGRVSFQSDRIPVTGEPREVIGERIEAGGQTFTYNAATIGNPHCVIPLDDISEELARRIGPEIENHANFPQRINLQLLKAIDRNTIQIEIWERGAGYTLASGSSSSAAAAVAHKIGLCDRDIRVRMPGGEIEIQISEDYDIHMSGPATRVGTMVLDENFLSGVA